MEIKWSVDQERYIVAYIYIFRLTLNGIHRRNQIYFPAITKMDRAAGRACSFEVNVPIHPVLAYVSFEAHDMDDVMTHNMTSVLYEQANRRTN